MTVVCSSYGVHVRPINKCKLFGTIVAKERRGGGAARSTSTIYVIDAGTGVIDCLCWNDHDGNAMAKATTSMVMMFMMIYLPHLLLLC